MVTGFEIGLGIKALKSAMDVAKEIKGLNDTAAIHAKIIEMQNLIMEAQASAIDAREDHAAQVKRVRDLEEEMARMKAWEAEKQRYELKAPWLGATLYALKPAMYDGEPPHWLCVNCYNQGKKRVLQICQHTPAKNIWACPDCDGRIIVSSGIAPQ
jgi:hypothetical protein